MSRNYLTQSDLTARKAFINAYCCQCNESGATGPTGPAGGGSGGVGSTGPTGANGEAAFGDAEQRSIYNLSSLDLRDASGNPVVSLNNSNDLLTLNSIAFPGYSVASDGTSMRFLNGSGSGNYYRSDYDVAGSRMKFFENNEPLDTLELTLYEFKNSGTIFNFKFNNGLKLNGINGVDGQVFTCKGPNVAPEWASIDGTVGPTGPAGADGVSGVGIRGETGPTGANGGVAFGDAQQQSLTNLSSLDVRDASNNKILELSSSGGRFIINDWVSKHFVSSENGILQASYDETQNGNNRTTELQGYAIRMRDWVNGGVMCESSLETTFFACGSNNATPFDFRFQSGLKLNSLAGSDGQVFTCKGPNAPPEWSSLVSSFNVTASQDYTITGTISPKHIIWFNNSSNVSRTLFLPTAPAANQTIIVRNDSGAAIIVNAGTLTIFGGSSNTGSTITVALNTCVTLFLISSSNWIVTASTP